MTVDEVYVQNQKVLSKEEERRKEDEAKRKSLFPKREITEKPVEKPIETANDFLKKEGPSRLFSVPMLTKTEDSSDDDVCFIRLFEKY